MSIEQEVNRLESKIYLIRGERVMLDFDLATLYQVPTKRLKEQVKRNQKRFPPDFMFILSEQELANLRSQIATSSLAWGGRRHLPFAFTEHGVAMLSSVLNSEQAISVNIAIMRAFAQMRRVLISTEQFESKLQKLELKYSLHDHKFKIVFDALRKLMSPQVVPQFKVTGLADKDK
jgi:hypothetical protein